MTTFFMIIKRTNNLAHRPARCQLKHTCVTADPHNLPAMTNGQRYSAECSQEEVEGWPLGETFNVCRPQFPHL